MRHRLLALSLFVVALVAAGAVSIPSVQARDSIPPTGPGRFEYPHADNVRVVSQWCLPDGTVGIDLRWTSYNLGTQWIDLSHVNNGWVFGTFVGMGPFAPWENSLVPWFGIRSNAVLFIRVNTFNGFTWFPSQTIAFQTTNCFPQFPPFPPQPPFPPPFPPGNVMCDPVTGWCPGQPPPPSRCSFAPQAQAQVQVAPAFPAGCVWPTKGNAAHYNNGENIVVCYWVNQPMNVVVDIELPGGGTTGVVSGFDDGRGNCVDPPGGVAIPPVGERTIRLTGNGQQLDTSNYFAP